QRGQPAWRRRGVRGGAAACVARARGPIRRRPRCPRRFLVQPRMSVPMSDGLRVLFVEDEPLVRQATAQSLELAGFQVLALPSAESAMPHLSPGFPGVLVTAVRLGGASGLDLLH